MSRRLLLSNLLLHRRRIGLFGCAKPCSAVCTTQPRKQSTLSVSVPDKYVKKFMKAVGWIDGTHSRLKLTGYVLYESILDNVDYEQWFRKLDLPDTFASWFIVTELHVWLLMVRYMQEDEVTTNDKKRSTNDKSGDGLIVRNSIVEAMWADIGNRIKLLEDANQSIVRKQISVLSEQFQAAVVSYDEGLSDDRILAGAVWRRIFQMSPDTDAENVEVVVHYIRHQLCELDKLTHDVLKNKSSLQWLSIEDH